MYLSLKKIPRFFSTEIFTDAFPLFTVCANMLFFVFFPQLYRRPVPSQTLATFSSREKTLSKIFLLCKLLKVPYGECTKRHGKFKSVDCRRPFV